MPYIYIYSGRVWFHAAVAVLARYDLCRAFLANTYTYTHAMHTHTHTHTHMQAAFGFEVAVAGMARYDVCRAFLATLQLANDGNVDIRLAVVP